MLSSGNVTDNWLRAFSAAQVQVCVLVQIDIDVSTSYKFVSIPGALSYDPCVSRISSMGVKMDPFERTTQTSEMTITFVDDGALRSLIASNRLKNRRVTVKVGATSLAEADYAPLWRGVVHEPRPGYGYIELVCRDGLQIAAEHQWSGSYVGKHPLEVILQILQDSSVPSDLIDSTTLDPTAAAFSAIAHFCMTSASRVVNRYGITDVYRNELGSQDTSSIKSADAINSIARMLVGTVAADETGKIRFSTFDTTASTVATWTTDDILTGSFKQISTYENIVNDIRIHSSFDSGQDGENSQHSDYCQIDAASQTHFAYPDGTAYVSQRKLEWPLGGPSAALEDGSITSGATTFSLVGMNIAGFSGTRGGYPAASQSASVKISASNKLYIKMVDEIISATGITLDDTNVSVVPTYDKNGNVTGTTTVPNRFTLSGVTRGDLGTTAIAHTKAIVDGHAAHDITMAIYYATVQLTRFSNGAPVIELKTNLDQYKVQLGDLVTLTHDVFLRYGDNGITTSDRWEVIGKEVDLFSDTPGITWTLCWATETSPIATSVSHATRGLPGTKGYGQIMTKSSSHGLDTGQKAVPSGLSVTATSGLNATISAGSVSVGVLRQTVPSDIAITVPASKDTYVGIDHLTAGAILNSTTTGASEPDVQANEIRIAKIVAGGAAITTIYDLRETASLGPKNLTSESFVGRRLLNGDFRFFSKGTSYPPDRWEMRTGTWGADAGATQTFNISGTYAVSMGTTTATEIQYSDYVSVIPSMPYIVTWWAKLKFTTNPTLTPKVVWYDYTKTVISTSTGSANGTAVTTWQHWQSFFTSPSNAVFAKVYFTKNSSGNLIYLGEIDFVPCPVSFSAYQDTGSPQSVAAGSFQTVTLDLEQFDYGDDFTAAGGAGHSFTAPTDGLYEFTLHVGLSSLAANKAMEIGPKVNVTQYSGPKITTASSGDHALCGTWLFNLANADTVKFLVKHSDAVNRNVTFAYAYGKQIA